jgi:hypothetical protein
MHEVVTDSASLTFWPRSQKISERVVNTILAVLLIGSQTIYYEAKVPTFGCTSIEEVTELQEIRSDQRAFQMKLAEKSLYGQCVTVLQGTVVEGSIEPQYNSILRVNGQVSPPGYEAPLDDFEIKAAGEKQ